MMKNKYCESLALGIGAPECSEDCCCYGSCHKKAYFKYIANKHNTTPNKTATFVIDNREYSNEEVLEILKKHKAEEDKKYHKCERCTARYLTNNSFSMVTHNLLDERPDKCGAWGYATVPFIKGLKVSSTCGDGKEIKLCDNCILELLNWLNRTN